MVKRGGATSRPCACRELLGSACMLCGVWRAARGLGAPALKAGHVLSMSGSRGVSLRAWRKVGMPPCAWVAAATFGDRQLPSDGWIVF